MDYFEAIQRRQSCRDFRAQPVERDKLIRCLQAAQIAPSACNSQPYSFIAVTQDDLAQKTAQCLQGAGMNKFVSTCGCFVIVVEEKANLSARVGAMRKQQDYTSVDIGIAAIQFCLAATAQSLSTCMLGWFDEGKLKALHGIDAGKRVRLVLCVGYARDEAVREKSRKPFDALVTLR